MAVKPLALRFARVFTIVFALSVLGYLVVEAQQRADSRAEAGATSPVQQSAPTNDPNTPGVAATPVTETPAGTGPAVRLEDTYVIQDPHSFLHSSKVAPILLDASGNPIEMFPPPPVEPERRTFIGSSKSLPLQVGLPEVHVEEGTFLPTSKSGRVILPVAEPEPKHESVD